MLSVEIKENEKSVGILTAGEKLWLFGNFRGRYTDLGV